MRPIGNTDIFQRINICTSAIYSAVCNSIMCTEVAIKIDVARSQNQNDCELRFSIRVIVTSHVSFS